VKRATESSIQEDLEEAQNTNGYLVRFQDNKMIEIDALKQQQIEDLRHEVEALK
jgi:hypothetical protein